MVRYRVLQILLLLSSIAFQVINSMMPQEISQINTMPFQVEGIAQRIEEELPKELKYKIISFALALLENQKYEVYKKSDVGSRVLGIALTRDTIQVLTGSNNGRLYLWDLEKGIVLKKLKGHTGTILPVALSSDGALALTGSMDDETARVWNMNTGELLKTFQMDSLITSVKLSADGNTALTGSLDGAIQVWNAFTGEPIKKIQVGSPVHLVALSANGKIALTGFKDGTACIWDIFTGELLKTLQVGSDVLSVALSADGTTALTGCFGDKVLVWDVKTGALLNTLLPNGRSIAKVALSKDGKRALLSTKDGNIQVWNTNPLPGRNQTTIPLTLLAGHTEQLMTLAFGSVDLIASGSCNGTVLIWKPCALEHYWPLKEGKLDWEALAEQQMAVWKVYKEIFSKLLLRSESGN